MNPTEMVGKSVIVHKDSRVEDVSAFYCDLCKCALKDSQAWIDHINGKKHNRLKGMSMVVERIDDVDRVRAKLASLNKNKEVTKNILGKRMRLDLSP